MIYFSPAWDISTFKRYFHCIMRAERSATRYPASKQAISHANRNHSSILQQIKLYHSPVWDISTSKRYFHCIMRAERSARVIQRRNKPTHTQIATIVRFWRKLCVISLQLKIFRCLYAVFTALCVPNLVHAFSIIETSPDTRKSQSFVDFVENYDLFLSRLRHFDV